MKYLEINLVKKVKDLYNDNYKNLMKLIKENTGKLNDIACPQIRKIILKCQYYPKLSGDSMQFLSKLQWHFLQKWKIIL